MIKTIGEGVEKYKKMLAVYFKRVETLKKKYGLQADPMRSYSGPDYDWVVKNNAMLRAAAKALGITQKESRPMERRIMAELGLKSSPKKK